MIRYLDTGLLTPLLLIVFEVVVLILLLLLLFAMPRFFFLTSSSALLISSRVTPWVDRRVSLTRLACAFRCVSLSSSRTGGTKDLKLGYKNIILARIDLIARNKSKQGLFD